MSSGGAPVDRWDFFVSYTQADRAWAEWIAWELEKHGYRVLIQAWDMVPGTNWVHRISEGVTRAARTVAVLSPDYLNSVYGTAEWLDAWRNDPLGERRLLVPVRVRDCERPGLLGQLVGVDLFGVGEAEARERLASITRTGSTGRGKPHLPPAFPSNRLAMPIQPRFPDALPPV